MHCHLHPSSIKWSSFSIPNYWYRPTLAGLTFWLGCFHVINGSAAFLNSRCVIKHFRRLDDIIFIVLLNWIWICIVLLLFPFIWWSSSPSFRWVDLKIEKKWFPWVINRKNFRFNPRFLHKILRFLHIVNVSKKKTSNTFSNC